MYGIINSRIPILKYSCFKCMENKIRIEIDSEAVSKQHWMKKEESDSYCVFKSVSGLKYPRVVTGVINA